MRKTPPPLQLMPAFEAAARHLSFKKAAAELNITPSAISQQIKNLEGFLDQLLFRRVTGGVFLTDEGEDFYQLAKRILEQYHQGYDDIYEKQAKPVIRISTMAYIAQNILIPELINFQEQSPDIDLRIESCESWVDFNKDGVDFAVRIGTEDAQENHWDGLDSLKLTDLSVSILASPNFLNQNSFNHIADIKNGPLIHARTSHDDWASAAQVLSLDLTASKQLYFNNYYSAISAAENGLGITLGMLPISNPSLKNNKLALVIDQKTPIPKACYLVYPIEKTKNQQFNIIQNWIVSIFKEL